MEPCQKWDELTKMLKEAEDEEPEFVLVLEQIPEKVTLCLNAETG